MTPKKTLYFIANWKLNHGKEETLDFIKQILPKINIDPNLICAIAPVNVVMDAARQALKGSSIKLCGQNIFYETAGPYTGECSAAHLRELGVEYCLVGHSERRQIFNETDQDVAKKVLTCLENHITPIICIGETAEERANGLLNKVLRDQISPVLDQFKKFSQKNVILAYEPVWAIGSGQTPSPQQAKESAKIIRLLIAEALGKEAACRCKILYGGSVSSQNILDFVLIHDIDGVLVGGASLQVSSFLAMVEKIKSVLL